MTSVRAHSTRARRGGTTLLALACLAVSLNFAAPAVSAPAIHHDRVISAIPGKTPAVNNGEVDAIVQVGDTMVVGGKFTSVTPVGVGATATTRSYLMAFNVSTGALVSTFAPALNGSVNELIPGPTAGTVYVGGAFTTVNGPAASHVTLLNTSTGAVVTGFKAASTNGVVYTMAKAGTRLVVGGSFTTAGGVAHGGLASLNGTTGKLDAYITSQVAVHHNNSGSGAQGPVGVRDLDVNAAGTRLVAIGNFKTVDGLSRDQVVMLTLGATETVTPDWQTNRYSPLCFSNAFDTYVRGVSFSPDGAYFVVASTGGGVTGTLCDAAARFETSAVGNNLQPTWVDYTGGDTLWAVTVTDKAVYVGGHQRWMNNSNSSDRAGGGAVPRPGLTALNTTTGSPLAWNPGRNPRGAAVYALYATSQGLWMGSDTEYIGNHRYRRARIAFFPLATGSPEASDAIASLPGTVFLGGNQNPATATTNDLRTAPVNTGGAQAATTAADGGVIWSAVRGSFLAGGKLYYGKSDGTFQSRTYVDGGLSFGPEVKVDPYNDPAWAGVLTGSNGTTFDGKVNDIYPAFSSTTSPVTGMAYAGGKLYYVRNNDSNLYWRWFNADSGIIGSQQFTANGGRSWTGTVGMFATGGKLYFVTKADGNLNSIALAAAGPAGVSSVLNGPLTGGNDWRARAVFLVNGPVAPPNVAPTASFTQSCTELVCDFDGGGSTDSDGSIVSYNWDFGDSTLGSGANVQHAYTGPGDYQVKLTVTDDDGAASSKTTTVSVQGPQANQISFVARSTAQANAVAPAVTMPAGVEAGDTLLLTASLSLATAAAAPSGWTQVGMNASTQLRSVVWARTATAGDVTGSPVAVTMEAQHKATLVLSAYRGVNAATVSATASIDTNTTSHTTPAVTVPGGSWVVSFWSEKSASSTVWTTPVTVSPRAEIHSSATNAVSQAVADFNGPSAGLVPGTTATVSAT
ncbi:MAG TPA: PKD domain-containing protein, partial [Nocardioidaceae bacterium]|nr:PKD domain-containing protein [Nocardioidaceae bacterium]